MKLDRYNKIYFIGIGGIGMSALARFFHYQGKNVSGYDRTPTDITDGLIELGIQIHFEDDVSQIDVPFLDSAQTLVIYTPAVPREHKELSHFVNEGFEVIKRADALSAVAGQADCLAIAGTHGKTTTTSILGHLLAEYGIEVTAFLGGISENYQSNLILKGDKVFVVEADEFDRSFLKLSPDMACITSMDADHLDIYGDKEELVKTFKAFASNVKPGGRLFVTAGLPIDGISCGIETNADYQIKNIKIEEGTYVFDLQTPDSLYENFKFNLPGRHNLSNALIALAMAIEYGCAPYRLVRALASYKGVKRRFTYLIKSDHLVVIDDYAHHPEEINAVYDAVREMYPGKRTLVLFQPHLYSRTQDFAEEFAESLSKFDEVLLLDIYPAREKPIEGVTSSWLLDKVNNKNKRLISKAEILSELEQSSAQVIMTLGAGDIGEEAKSIKEKLSLAS
ncbi:MAG: UDP-N-acetylmuramate--L-alanine ligase [Bacteroidia bacterium]|nr:UDP-N-acetylmuramate--L-alanine ligase [Bacteroidia bacterium]MBT8270308.1 UDP-N-acetylmuramate--L-alanine ligase [Bacteroidia bacterium]NNF82972.1 UDP-N-acetylmuramate--L-alanine ligase [Flavobacteriaceae bacterium]NNK69889.1 UDP-N-acetylmuramate--L-alanine ligase [Flavobacteriaceae bacterium]NNL80629.1 UDP-N-acetylmuramate--L-alanine ligase [Flavobacteriaceae bacterium]